MFGHTFYHIFVARLIAGLLGGGFQSTVVVFLSEIANDKQVFNKYNSQNKKNHFSQFSITTELLKPISEIHFFIVFGVV